MADMASSGAQRRFAETLQLKERTESLKTLASKPARAAVRQAKALAARIYRSRAAVFAKGLLSGLWSFLQRQASKLGRVGVVATVVTVITSKRGQQIAGKILGTVLRTVDAIAKGTIGVIGWVPFIGKPVAGVLSRARRWAWDKGLDMLNKAKRNVIAQSVMHDGVVSRAVRTVAAPYATFKLAGLLPGGWKILGYAAWVGYMGSKLLNSPVLGSKVADAVWGTATRKPAAPKVDLTKPVITEKRTVEPADTSGKPTIEQLADKVAADATAYRQAVDAAAKADETVEQIDTVLASNEAHVAAATEVDEAVTAHRTAAYENGKAAQRDSADRDQLVKDELDEFFGETQDGIEVDPFDNLDLADMPYRYAATIAGATLKYFEEVDNPALQVAKRDQALKLLVLPAFQALLPDNKTADSAAYQYCKKTVRAVNRAEAPYDEGDMTPPFSWRLKKALIDAVFTEVQAKQAVTA